MEQISFKMGYIYPLHSLSFNEASRSLPFVNMKQGYLRITGDDTGEHPVFIYFTKKKVGVYSDLERLVKDLIQTSDCSIKVAAIQFLLRFGFIPFPYSPYNHVWSLGIGDRFEIDLQKATGRYYVEFPYFRRNSREDITFNPKELKAQLAHAIASRLNGNDDVFVMQSAGKDSTSMMLGLKSVKQTGVMCVTYDASIQKEGEIAKAVAQKLGYNHQIIQPNAKEECRAFLDLCGKFPTLSCDHTLTAYCYSLKKVGIHNSTVVDGSGNDGYMGYIPTQKDLKKFHLCAAQYFAPLWGLFEDDLLSTHLPNWHRYLCIYPIELFFPGAMISNQAIREMTGKLMNQAFFKQTRNYHRRMHPLDFKAYFRGRIYDHCSIAQKIRTALHARSTQPIFPYCDQGVIDYYFNLPGNIRYDYPNCINKIGLRRFCESELGSQYLQYVSQDKGFFKYDMDTFIQQNGSTIKDEILSGMLPFKKVEKWWRIFWDRRDRSYSCQKLYYLFCVSAWLNRRPNGVNISFETNLDPMESPSDIELNF